MSPPYILCDITKLITGFYWGTNWYLYGEFLLCQFSYSGTTVPRIPFCIQPWAGLSHKRHSAHDLEGGRESPVVFPSCLRGQFRVWNAVTAPACCHLSPGTLCQHVAAPTGLPLSVFPDSWVRCRCTSTTEGTAASPSHHPHHQSGRLRGSPRLVQIRVHAPGFRPLHPQFLLNVLVVPLHTLPFPNPRPTDCPCHMGSLPHSHLSSDPCNKSLIIHIS